MIDSVLPVGRHQVSRSGAIAHRIAGVMACAGVTAIVVGYRMARTSTGPGHFAVFWVGMALLLLAVAWIGTRPASTARQRAAWLATYGVACFVPKALMSPSGPVYFDEYAHWRHINDVLATGHLDVATPYLPVLRYYPGLAVLTAAVHAVTRLSTWHAGQLIVALAHSGTLLLVLALGRVLGLSGAAAFLAALIYSLNPSYLYFDAQYGYESVGLALALAAVVLSTRSRRAATSGAAWRRAAAALVLSVLCVMTHHVSAIAGTALLVLVAITVPRPGGAQSRDGRFWAPIGVAVAAAGSLAAWIGLVARPTTGYLTPALRTGALQLVDIVTGSHRARDASGGRIAESSHHLFAGSQAPSYEVICALAAPLLAVVAVAVAVRHLRRTSEGGPRRLMTAAIAVAALYFASLPFALTTAGGEAAHRSWAFTYVGVSLTAAAGLPVWRSMAGRLPRTSWVPAAAAVLIVLAIGNVASGLNVAYRFPGPYEFGTDTRSRTPEVTQLARWADAQLQPGAKVVTDRFTGELVTGYTRLLAPSPDESPAYALFRHPRDASPALRSYLDDHGFRYFILDTRILSQQPQQRFFQGYVAPLSVSPTELSVADASSILRLLHKTPHYEVFEIRP